ncbi:hypothetical protein Desor_2241 [Desulfosporosinus orientis DSM 765]|uniref:Uncharacterized protein n=1 Tax=Desulfosporosinus orientis (strain ATCC 19365 / DSM 765 / NCIMB 8382 / VKM B-1628 / Singapore I) TaxID=768706 RepID=G7WB62_DESOD|nr:hypothetical protein [Desulfosporosinus orientis]AET67843.1 hypothetical protein Desor_2241 [Desulfosporosinus orientis DSM 765]
MIIIERLFTIGKENLLEFSKTLQAGDISQLVEWLNEKDDKLRYHSLLLLERRSEEYDDVYSYWNVFCEKLTSTNSYQRSIGVMLIAANVKWDKENRIDNSIDDYLRVLNDEKPITVRQCIQSLDKIVSCRTDLHYKVTNKLISIDIMDIKPTMRKLILIDILNILVLIKKHNTSEEIDTYIFKALTGGLLDKKAIKQVELML